MLGVTYGSAGEITTLLTIGVAGGNENTDQSELSTIVAAIVARRVDIAAVMVSQPSSRAIGMEQVIHEREPLKCYPFDMG